MKVSPARSRWPNAVAVAIAFGLSACSDTDLTDVHPIRGGPQEAVTVPAPVQKQAVVCADGPTGTYTFTIAETNDPNNIGTLLVASPFSLSAGQCATVAQSSQAGYFVTVTVEVTSTGMPVNVVLDSILKTQWVYDSQADTQPDPVTTKETGPAVSFELGIERAADLVFNFSGIGASLSITKTADAASVAAGNPIGFTITVSSDGPGTATSVMLKDSLPTGTGISWTIDPTVTGCSITNNVLNCSFGDLANGDSREVHVTSPTGNASCNTYPNKASATATNVNRVEATASVTVTGCQTVCTATQGGWGQDAKGKNIGSLRDRHFATVFPTGLVVGGTFKLTLTTAKAVNKFLPAGSTPAALIQNYNNPTTTSAGVFAGQVVALKLNVAFSAAGAGGWTTGLGATIVTVGPPAIQGLTVDQVLAIAESVLGGGALPTGVSSISQLNQVVSAINETNSPDGCSFGNGNLL